MPPESNEKSPLENVRSRLYAPTATPSFTVPDLKTRTEAPAEAWKPLPPPPAPKPPRFSRATMFLMIAGGFFVVAIIVAALLIIFGGRTVSTDNVDILLPGAATTAGSGETVAILITVKNGNPVEITDTTLSVDFPDGTRSPEDVTKSLSHYSDTLGSLAAGASADRTVRAVVFGSEGQKVTVPIRFEYRTPGSNTPFVKEASYELTITTSPLSISVGSLTQVSAGQPFTVAVSVRSNATAPIAGAALQVDYPPGFVARSATPAPVSGSLFDLGTLEPGQERTVSITGILSGENNETRVFRFTTGTLSASTGALGVSYTTTQVPVSLERAFLATTLLVNRDTAGDAILTTGQQLDGVLSWINTLTAPIQDAQLSIALTGSGFDPASVNVSNGVYRSGDRTIVFSKERIAALAQIGPSETGNGTFYLSTKKGDALTGLRNPTVTFTVSVAGRRINESNVPTTAASTITRTYKIGTDLSLVARAVRTTGAFKNTGPWPPVADKESTYTIEWSLANTVNSVGTAKVTGQLPSNVRFTGQSSPSDGSVTYNEVARTVTWNAGDVAAGTTAKKMSFQVALTPRSGDRGTSPVLVTGQQVTGIDRFTEGKLTGSAPELTTLILSDPAFQATSGQVQ